MTQILHIQSYENDCNKFQSDTLLWLLKFSHSHSSIVRRWGNTRCGNGHTATRTTLGFISTPCVCAWCVSYRLSHKPYLFRIFSRSTTIWAADGSWKSVSNKSFFKGTRNGFTSLRNNKICIWKATKAHETATQNTVELANSRQHGAHSFARVSR